LVIYWIQEKDTAFEIIAQGPGFNDVVKEQDLPSSRLEGKAGLARISNELRGMFGLGYE
jgi:hypothetical protein